jgi:hypothetical protein
VCELDAEVFEKFCEKLEPDEKEKMQKVFKDIWPISVPNVHWFGSPFE